MFKLVSGNSDGFRAEAKPPTKLNLDGLNFAVRAPVDLDHLTEFLAVRTVNGPSSHCCQPLECLLQRTDHSLTRLRKRGALFYYALPDFVGVAAFLLDVVPTSISNAVDPV